MRADFRAATVRKRNSERGTAILEFPFAGIPLIFLVLVTFEICLAMWSYHTLASAVNAGAVYACTKGQDCSYGGNNCQVEIEQIVQRILAAGTGLDASQLNLTFYSSASNTTISCAPASNCLSNATQWPGGVPNMDYIKIQATYPAPISIPALLWPGQSLSAIGAVQFSASSYQMIQF